MKIANKHIILASGVLAWSLAGSPFPTARAEPDAPMVPPPAATASPSLPAPAPAHVAAAPTSSMLGVTMAKSGMPTAKGSAPEIKIPDLSNPLPGGKKDAKNADNISAKVPESVKDVIKHLSSRTEDVTLDDLNAAREAVAKLDALIDIERRLSDLEKIRDDRTKESEKKLTEAIPRAALTPPLSFTPAIEKPPAPKGAPLSPPKPPQVEVDVVRIEGSNNRYGALVRDGGTTRMVHAGDHLSDGSVVLSVNTQGVQIERDKTTRLTQVKDVQGVFGDSP